MSTTNVILMILSGATPLAVSSSMSYTMELLYDCFERRIAIVQLTAQLDTRLDLLRTSSERSAGQKLVDLYLPDILLSFCLLYIGGKTFFLIAFRISVQGLTDSWSSGPVQWRRPPAFISAL